MSLSQKLFCPAALLAVCFSLLADNALAQHYTETDLTANRSGVSNAANIDPNLVNPWGSPVLPVRLGGTPTMELGSRPFTISTACRSLWW